MLKSSAIYRKNDAYLVKKGRLKQIRILHFQGLNALNMQKLFWFVSNFEHVKFAISENIPQKIVTIQTIMFHLWYFKHNVIFKSIHLFGWFLWLCFYPIVNYNGKIQLRTIHQTNNIIIYGSNLNVYYEHNFFFK